MTVIQFINNYDIKPKLQRFEISCVYLSISDDHDSTWSKNIDKQAQYKDFLHIFIIDDMTNFPNMFFYIGIPENDL